MLRGQNGRCQVGSCRDRNGWVYRTPVVLGPGLTMTALLCQSHSEEVDPGGWE